ncbi:metal ABC transporter permease [Ramlibacter montanisoli]|uniref:Metal ABC transporter permease n=1 Tax=Ramlibacter montanisoli TaxID=2732512 RepID=A0A849KB16_9BURK|nr:metal ABC transporter permease [Ramlibacter montanisoli]NNU44620.1 metal ABC transporter permease [Ramlibacter montanisoli]
MNADLAWLAAPAAALLLASLVLVPLGAQVLARGVVFIDLAVAQIAACGVLAAGALVEEPGALLSSVAAAAAALLGSAGVWWLARRWPEQREALIGLVYVAGAGISVIAVAFDPHGRERLARLLAADVLWVPWSAVLLLAAAASLVLTLSALRGGVLRRDAVFYPAFALALSMAVQTLGLYLVFALLIGPALWTQRGVALGKAVPLGVAACLAGMGWSWAFDWPSGASTALALCLLGILAVWRAPVPA